MIVHDLCSLQSFQNFLTVRIKYEVFDLISSLGPKNRGELTRLRNTNPNVILYGAGMREMIVNIFTSILLYSFATLF